MKTIKFATILLLSLLNCTTVFPNSDYGSPVDLHYNDKTNVDGINSPSRYPQGIQFSLEVNYDTFNNQLIFSDNWHQNYYYALFDENSIVVSEGNLDFGNQEQIVIDLIPLSPGSYTLAVVHGEYEFTGSLDI